MGHEKYVLSCFLYCVYRHQKFPRLFLNPHPWMTIQSVKSCLHLLQRWEACPPGLGWAARRAFSARPCPRKSGWLSVFMATPASFRLRAVVVMNGSSLQQTHWCSLRGARSGLSPSHPIWFHKCLPCHEVWKVPALWLETRWYSRERPDTDAVFLELSRSPGLEMMSPQLSTTQVSDSLFLPLSRSALR